MLGQSMDFRLQNTDGPAQSGILSCNDGVIETPNILFIQTKRYSAPDFAQILLTKEKQRAHTPQFIIGNNIFTESPLDTNTVTQCLSSYTLFPKDVSDRFLEWAHKNNEINEKDCTLLSGNKEHDIKHLQDYDRFFIIGSAQQLYQHPTEFVEYITQIRDSIPYDSLVYTPSIAQPSNLALLTYFGIDLFDSTQAILAARNNTMLFPTTNLSVKDLKLVPCNCPSCISIKNPEEMNFEKILHHNYHSMFQEIKLIQTYIKTNNLRKLVEIRITSNPHLVTLLRTLDRQGFDYLEKRTPLHTDNILYATTFESMHRPEIYRFQQRVLERFRKPRSTSILLLLPCSMKKPYSFSQSHRKFHDAIFSSKNPYCIHELIITSPIGLVPRELECIYPASSYDIPVTGHWYKDEQMMIRTLLEAYLKKNTYEKILVHLSEEMVSFIKDIIPDGIYTDLKGSPNNAQAINTLTELIKNETQDAGRISGRQRWFDHVHSLATYQFTEPLADSLLKNTSIIGKYPYLKIMDEKKQQLGMTTEKRGYISLTIHGGKRLLTHQRYLVKLTPDFTLKGSVFAPGIEDADKDIRKGDEVLVLQNNMLQGVGVAMMNGEEMKKRSYGEAVKVRHKNS